MADAVLEGGGRDKRGGKEARDLAKRRRRQTAKGQNWHREGGKK